MNQHQYSLDQIVVAVKARKQIAVESSAWRAFNGFYEGIPGLVLDVYGRTLVIFNHNTPGSANAVVWELLALILEVLPEIDSVLLKERQHPEDRLKNGILLFGQKASDIITEFDVPYYLDLQINQDAGFYLDTRNLRRWLLDRAAGWRVLNTFAYTGSLGVAAGVGGAALVVQTDLNEKFLEIAKKSWELNELSEDRAQILPGDFFRVTGRMRRDDRLFDCVILDPPFFSTTTAGRIDLERETTRLVNKVRPLIAHKGWLVVINNALYLSGADFMTELEALCAQGFLTLEEIISVPQDVIGLPGTTRDQPPVDPAPFNHPTKIAVLRAYRKDERV